MKATEARTLTEEGQKVDMIAIYDSIRARARQGYECHTIDIQTLKHKASVEKVLAELKENGFRASRSSGYDQRDGTGWDQLSISW